VNFWDSLLTLIIVSGIVLFLLFLEKVIAAKYVAKHQDIFHKIRVAGQGFLTMQFYNVYAEMVLFSVIDFRTTSSGNAGINWAGFIIAIFFTILAILMLMRHYKLVKKYQDVRKKASEAPAEEGAKQIEQFNKENDATLMLYQDFKEYSFLQQSYLLILTIRNALSSFVISMLFAHPIPQVALITVMNVATILYLIFKAPFKNLFNVLQQIAFEMDLFVVHVCFLTLACLDSTQPGKQSARTRIEVGNAIMMAIFLTKFLPMITLIPKVILLIITIRQTLKEKKAAKEAAAAKAAEEKEKESAKTAVDAETALLVSPNDVNLVNQQQMTPVKKDRKDDYMVHDDEEKLIKQAEPTPDAPEEELKTERPENQVQFVDNTPASPDGLLTQTNKPDKSVSYMEEDFDDSPGINPIMRLGVRDQIGKY